MNSHPRIQFAAVFAILLIIAVAFPGCTIKEQSGTTGGAGGGLAGKIVIDGSSTVAPISQAVAEEFKNLHNRVNPVVGTSGTGGGFDKFIRGETDISDASRPIKTEEIERCREAGIEYLELKVAIDGLSVVVNPENDWCDCLSVARLKAIWQKDSRIKLWSDINPAWPQEKIDFYAPDVNSGTFDYFTEEICGETGNTRVDYTPSTDDNVLVQGVSGDRYSLGYFGYAYYAENQDKLKVVGVKNGEEAECIKPTGETIEAGRYTPLSRPLFLYVNKKSLQRPEVAEFLKFYLSEGQDLVAEVGYVRLSTKQLDEVRQRLDEALPTEIAAK